MKKDKNQKRDPKDQWSSFSLDLDFGELTNKRSREGEPEVKKARRGRPRKTEVASTSEEPVKKATRKQSVKKAAKEPLAKDLFLQDDGKLDFAIGAVVPVKRPRGRPRKVVQQTDQTDQAEKPVAADPWSSLVSQLDEKVATESSPSQAKAKSKAPAEPMTPVPDLNASDFSLEDFFATDEKLEIAWGKSEEEPKRKVEQSSSEEKSAVVEEEPAPDEDFFGFAPKENEVRNVEPVRDQDAHRGDTPYHRGRDRGAPPRRDQDRNRERNRDNASFAPAADPLDLDRHGRDRNRDRRRGDRRPSTFADDNESRGVVESAPVERRPSRYEQKVPDGARRPRREEESTRAFCQPAPDTPFAGIFDDDASSFAEPVRFEEPATEKPERVHRDRREPSQRPERSPRHSAPEDRQPSAAPETGKPARKTERPQFSTWNEAIDTVIQFNINKHAQKSNSANSGNRRR